MKRTIFFTCFFLVLASLSTFPEVIIIANPDTHISSLKNSDIQDIFTGKRTRWNGSGKIIIATLSDSDVHKKFLEQFVKKTPSQFKNYWRSKVFTGEGMIPKIFQNEESLIEFVANTKGAVGYISGPTNKPVKVITIEDSQGGGR
jgi:ABC-type phosphate transport system substrate-binding protein